MDAYLYYYTTIHTQLCSLKTALTIDPRTGRVSTASVLQAKNKKRPTKWWGPYHKVVKLRGEQNGKEKKLPMVSVPQIQGWQFGLLLRILATKIWVLKQRSFSPVQLLIDWVIFCPALCSSQCCAGIFQLSSPQTPQAWWPHGRCIRQAQQFPAKFK